MGKVFPEDRASERVCRVTSVKECSGMWLPRRDHCSTVDLKEHVIFLKETSNY